jgi:hypothetical protein
VKIFTRYKVKKAQEGGEWNRHDGDRLLEY